MNMQPLASDAEQPAWLVLENGTIMQGTSIGKRSESFGELVFNTACTGYQEILTDPSYAGQMVMMTTPEVGNYGINTQDVESTKMHLAGFIVRRLSNVTSNWRAAGSLDVALKHSGIVGIQGIDTRALTRQIRAEGALKCGITPNGNALEEFLQQVKAQPSLDDQDMVSQVSTPSPYLIHPSKYTTPPLLDSLLVIDYGIKQNILRLFEPLTKTIHVLPASADFAMVKTLNPQAVFLSNGPGDPRRLSHAVQLAKQVMDNNIPLFGICLGHQIIAMALGLQAHKMPFGHHGSNHPVKEVATGEILITSQNHSYCVSYPEDAHLAQEVEITYVNLNDGTVEGLKHKHLPVWCVQFHPEAAPGPQEAQRILNQMVEACANASQAQRIDVAAV
jgi:carbamoyl-phosphate synthase small subunit